MPTFLTGQPFIFLLLGGLGLFLYGMKIMSEGLQKIAGDRMRRIFGALTDNRLVGMLIGMSVTALIQSSTATTVMVVSFVNAGLMSLVQAIGVVIGANIGTTVTAQLIAFKVAGYALPTIGLGVALRILSSSQRLSRAGEVILGLGLVFFGLALMKDAFDPMRGNQQLQNILLAIGDNRLLGVLAGAVITMLVQSSSATIGLTIAMATSGLIGLETSVALVLGENIGTTVTANIAAIGASLAARRAALAHMLFNVLGVCCVLLLFPLFTGLVAAITPGEPDYVIVTAEQVELLGGGVGDKPFIARHIANAHTIFNVLNALLFLPLVGHLARLTARLLPGRDIPAEFPLNYLDTRVLNTPPIALAQARAEIKRMSRVTSEVLAETLRLLDDQHIERLEAISRKEQKVDLLQREILDFLVALSRQSVTEETSREVASLMHIVNDLEKIGDHCVHLGRLVRRKLDQRIEFSEAARREIGDISRQVEKFFRVAAQALDCGDRSLVENAQEMEAAIERLENLLRGNHIARLNTGECSVGPGLIYIDMLHDLEKIGDHTAKIAKEVQEYPG